MVNLERIDTWIASGKQVGHSLTWEIGGEVCWSSVGVQFWEGKYLVSVDEILESNMVAEIYERDEIVGFDTLEEARRFVISETRVAYEDLHPCKGQRVFNPKAFGL